MDRVTGVRAKIERAEKHIRDLNREVGQFLSTNPYKAIPKYNPQSGYTSYYLISFAAVPEPITAIIGDAIHNLRSAWDHLAYQLALSNGITDENSFSKVCFPIGESRKEYKRIFERKVQPFLSEKANKAIELLQPHKGANDEFWAIHWLDIIDKHRALITGVTSAILAIEVGYDDIVKFMPGVDLGVGPESIPSRLVRFDNANPGRIGTKEGDVVLMALGNHETDNNIKLIFEVAFGEPEVFKGRPIVKHLAALTDFFSNLINRVFVPLL